MTETFQMRFYSGVPPNNLLEDKGKSSYLGGVSACFGAMRGAPMVTDGRSILPSDWQSRLIWQTFHMRFYYGGPLTNHIASRQRKFWLLEVRFCPSACFGAVRGTPMITNGWSTLPRHWQGRLTWQRNSKWDFTMGRSLTTHFRGQMKI